MQEVYKLLGDSQLRGATVLLLAASLDRMIGDPQGWLHPVQIMGWVISRYTDWIIRRQQRWARRLAGISLGMSLIGGSGLLGWTLVRWADWLHPLTGALVEVVMLASCFAGRSLHLAALEILQPLIAENLELARTKLSYYVGRDTYALSPVEILRATLETVAENTPDGVTAPLFYAIVGAGLPGVGSVPLTLAYKAASTLDSMIGYRREPYTHLGWFSAQLEDRLTWLPCRLTVFTLAILGRKPQQVWSLCCRDAVKDPSPNSGWSECAYAAILGIQLGGMNFYSGVAQHKPLLGNPDSPITPAKIKQALEFMRDCFLTWLGIAVVGLLSIHFLAKL